MRHMMTSEVARRLHWLIARHRANEMEVFTMGSDGGETLAVFSFKEEAEMFLRLGIREGDWRVRPITAGELVSMLYGPCSGVRRVALDPPPETGGRMILTLLSLGSRDFVQILLGEKPSTSRLALRQAIHGLWTFARLQPRM